MAAVRQQVLADAGVLAPDRMTWPRDTEAALVAVGQVREATRDRAHQRHRQAEPAAEKGPPSVGGDAQDVLRHHPGAAPCGQQHRAGAAAQVHRDVDRRIAEADDEHALALERRRRAVVVRVQRLAVETARESGPARIPEVAVGDDHRAILARAPVVERYLPAPACGGFDCANLAPEAHVLAHSEALCVGFEVLEHLPVRQEVRLVVGDGEVRVTQAPAARVDMQAAVGRRHAVVVLVAPHAAEIGSLLEDLEGQAAFEQCLRGGDARGTGTDDADVGHGRSAQAISRALNCPQPASTSCPAECRSLVRMPRRCSARAIAAARSHEGRLNSSPGTAL